MRAITKPNPLKKWINHTFESTKEFTQFSTAFKKFVVSELPEGCELLSFSQGHFFCSGFIKRGDSFIYFSVGDVRHKTDWPSNILVRIARDAKDCGGAHSYNWWATTKNFGSMVKSLFDREERKNDARTAG